ncbi:hypothetical protein C8J57DRAFT_1621195 [Mycena rebaudengoi]|nr:hypothetical protein C8J57DRAFT_1621195 [Mycena rebaudengoi]
MPPAPEFTGPKLPQGIPKELDTRLNHLSKLLQFLPTLLRLDPTEEDSSYCFYLDPDDTHKLCGGKLVFQERGKRLLQLVAFLRIILKEGTLPEARIVQRRWIERLITAAEDSGAKIIHKTKKRQLDNNSDAEDISTELQQRTLFQFGAKKLTATEAEAQQKRHAAESKERMLAATEREKKAKEHATERRRECGRDRQQKWRDRKKSSGEKQWRERLKKVSRPSGQNWKAERTGKKNGVIQRRHERVNWYHPFLWLPIARTAPRVAFSPSMLVKVLQRENPGVYDRLNKGTVQKWLSKEKMNEWSTKTKANISRRHALAGTGRVGVLSPYPELVDAIKSRLADLQTAGICVGRLLARSFILTVIQEKRPELLEKFKCSESYVGGFLESVMDWSLRHGTRAAAHIPDNVREVCKKAFFRVVHLINFYDIPPELIINMDQTGVILLVANNKTCSQKSANQVWAGATKASLPDSDALGMDDAQKLGFHFAFTNSKKKSSHFSTLKTMKEWMQNILAPYIKEQIEIHYLR